MPRPAHRDIQQPPFIALPFTLASSWDKLILCANDKTDIECQSFCLVHRKDAYRIGSGFLFNFLG